MDMMKCLAYIEKNLEMPISVKQIAERMGYSEYHFSREFKKVMGTSIMDYVIRRKLVKASEMLISGKSVLETAVQFGWQSHGGFTKAFKREYGFSPSLLKILKETIVGRLPAEIRQILMEAVKFDVKRDVLTEQKEGAVMVKLADRLHNMRTLDFLEENRRPQKAKETIEFFMPMAQKLGNQKIIEELNDLSLAYLK